MNNLQKEKNIVKILSFKDGLTNSHYDDNQDFRKDLDIFIKNINFKTKKNLNNEKKDKDKEINKEVNNDIAYINDKEKNKE